MNAAECLLIQLRTAGIAVTVEGGEIRCRAARGKLTPDLVHQLKAMKPAVLDILTTEQQEIDWRVESIGEALLKPSAAPAQAGFCRYCGAAMPGKQTGKCVSCCLAAAQVYEEQAKKTQATYPNAAMSEKDARIDDRQLENGFRDMSPIRKDAA